MRNLWLVILLGLALPPAGFALGQSQASSNQTPSLGDLARQLRNEREKTAAKPKVFTNDNLPARPPEEKLSVASGMSESPTEEKGEKAGAKAGEQAGAKTSAEENTHGEKYYRKHAAEIRTQLALHQRELSILQQKFSQGEMQYYPDPNKTLQQSSTPQVNSDINKLRDEIGKKKQQIADDQKAMDDLTDRLRRDGGDPGWLR